jgi:hypothetical protein
MLRDDPFPGIIIRGFCSCELNALDSADCAGKGAALFESSLVALLLPASLGLFECLVTSGDERDVASGETARGVSGACAEGGNSSSARRFEDDGRVFFRRRFGWLGDRLGGRDPGRVCSRNDCADAAALRFMLERPACCTWRSSLASM